MTKLNVSKIKDRIAFLTGKHATLDAKLQKFIGSATSRILDHFEIQTLKIRKCNIRREITSLEARLRPHLVATSNGSAKQAPSSADDTPNAQVA